MNDEILEALEERPFQKVEVFLKLSSHQEEKYDVCCPNFLEGSPLETILAVVRQTDQPKVKEELQLPGPNQVEDNTKINSSVVIRKKRQQSLIILIHKNIFNKKCFLHRLKTNQVCNLISCCS